MNALSKVELNQKVTHFNMKLTELIENYSNEVGINSERTKIAYRDDVAQFFKYFNCNNESAADVVYMIFTRNNIVKYRSYLLEEKKLSASTINRKMCALKEFIKYLSSYGYNIDINIINQLSKLKTTNNSYEALSLEEAYALINWIKDNENRKALDKYYYCLLALDTGVRAEALNKLTKASFVIKEDEVIVKGVDKGKKAYTKVISREFYDNMHNDLKFDQLNLTDNIFNFSGKNRTDMLNRAKKSLGWVNRNITFHSFKKGAVTYAYECTKDIRVAMNVGSHSNMETTQRYIADNEEAFKGAVSNNFATGVKDVDFNNFEKDQLIEVLKSLPEAIQLQVKTELNKIK